MKIGKKYFDFAKQGYIMGILNVTPDSFSDGGKFHGVEKAMVQVRRMIEEGVDLIDIGGESTRPGHVPVSAEEEKKRILPVIEAIRKESDVPLSVDTFKADTLEAALEAGANMANDVWGFMEDPRMAEVVKAYDVPVILMHNKKNNHYVHLMEDMKRELGMSIERALKTGIGEEKIVIDPGLGFALDYEKDLTVLHRLDALKELGFPILLGASKKRFIGHATGVKEPSLRTIGTVATTVVGYTKGARIFRVHDVKENKEALRMVMAIEREGGQEWIP